MKRKNKIILYSVLLFFSLTVFITEVFIIQKPDGILGLSICLISIYLIVGSLIKLCKLSKKFSNAFLDLLDLLFFLP